MQRKRRTPLPNFTGTRLENHERVREEESKESHVPPPYQTFHPDFLLSSYNVILTPALSDYE